MQNAADKPSSRLQNIVSFSGGKDSTAMLLMMLERNEPIHSVVFFDTGWEFPQMHDHVEQVEKYTGIEIVKLKPAKPFTYWMFEREVVARKGEMKGKVHRIGNGWPSPLRRWCTRSKVASIESYLKSLSDPVSCIGYAAEEQHRCKDNSRFPKRYPLIEWGMTEPDALAYCKRHGFNWGGLYNVFNRVSCFCCPLQRLSELRKLRKYYPELWQKMLDWDKAIPDRNRGFRDYTTVQSLDRRFEYEESLFASGLAI